MATLLDKLKQTLGGATAQAEPVADETGTVQQLLAARKGIVGAPAQLGPRGLAVAEVAARQPAQQKLAEIGQAAQLQATGIEQAFAGQAEEQKQRESAIEGQKQERALENRIQTENILRGLEQGRAELGEKNRRLGLEMVSANLRLADAKYVDDLRREGEKARLQEDISFGEQLQKSILENNQALLNMQLKNKSLLSASDRDFQKELAKMGAADAIKAARDNMKADSERAVIAGVTSLVPVGLEAYGTQQKGGFSGGYQSYVDSLPQGERPMSFTAWSAQQNQATTSPGLTSSPSVSPTVTTIDKDKTSAHRFLPKQKKRPGIGET